MSFTREDAEAEAAYERLHQQFGPEWAEEHRDDLYQEAIKEFTAERLRSYYLAHPNLAQAAHDSLKEAQSLQQGYPRAALISSAIAVEVGIKVVLLQPIVFGLVHTEALAELITDLTTQHTGMDRFQALLAEILKHYGGVDLKTYTRPDSKNTLWQEIGEIQKARNRVMHRGEMPEENSSKQGIAVADTILHQLFPEVLRKLNLHLHDPWVVCGDRHTTPLPVIFTIPGHRMRYVTSAVEINVSKFDMNSPPETITGALGDHVDESDLAAMRSAPSEAYMQVLSVPLRYQVKFEADSMKFTGMKVAWG